MVLVVLIVVDKLNSRIADTSPSATKGIPTLPFVVMDDLNPLSMEVDVLLVIDSLKEVILNVCSCSELFIKVFSPINIGTTFVTLFCLKFIPEYSTSSPNTGVRRYGIKPAMGGIGSLDLCFPYLEYYFYALELQQLLQY